MLVPINFSVVGLLSGLGLFTVLSGKKKNPIIDSMQKWIEEVSRGNYSYRFNVPLSDSLDSWQEKLLQIAGKMEKMQFRLKEFSDKNGQKEAVENEGENWREKFLIQAEVQKSLGDIVSGFAHEINNPLTGIFGYIDLLLIRESLSPEVKDKLIHIQQQATRIKSIIEKLNQLDPDSVHTKYEIDLVNLLDKMIKVFSSKHENRDIVFEGKLPDSAILVYGNHFSLWQALEQIIENSIEAIQERQVREGKIVAELCKSPDGQYAIVDIIDNGGGFTNISKAFDPFFTTKNRSQNKGIGLTIVFNIIKEHMGSILVSNNDNNGATVSVFLPVQGAFRNENQTFGG